MIIPHVSCISISADLSLICLSREAAHLKAFTTKTFTPVNHQDTKDENKKLLTNFDLMHSDKKSNVNYKNAKVHGDLLYKDYLGARLFYKLCVVALMLHLKKKKIWIQI